MIVMRGFFSTAKFCRSALGLALLVILSGWLGCQTAPPPAADAGAAAAGDTQTTGDDLLRVNDLVTITFTGISNPPPKHEERIKEDGSITPSTLFAPVKAAGKTTLQLQRELQDLYNKFFRNLTVTVATELRFFIVAGEVRRPDRFTYLGETTVLGAIATAGHFTDFANQRRVQLTRANGQQIRVDCIRARQRPELDLPVYPGDKIDVPKRRF